MARSEVAPVAAPTRDGQIEPLMEQLRPKVDVALHATRRKVLGFGCYPTLARFDLEL